jgi:hypothetical protein
MLESQRRRQTSSHTESTVQPTMRPVNLSKDRFMNDSFSFSSQLPSPLNNGLQGNQLSFPTLFPITPPINSQNIIINPVLSPLSPSVTISPQSQILPKADISRVGYVSAAAEKIAVKAIEAVTKTPSLNGSLVIKLFKYLHLELTLSVKP